jgi:hypothetical protein
MTTKLIFSTSTNSTYYWTDLPFIPRVNELVNVQDILKEEEIEDIKTSAKCWSGIRGIVQSVEYRHDDNEFFAEVSIWCED